jgi:two-component system sensor histidine kinase DesK
MNTMPKPRTAVPGLAAPAQENGWAKYGYLAYLVSLLPQAVFDPGFGLPNALVTLLSVAAFLPLYLRGWNSRDGRLLAYAWAIFGLGVAVTPLNGGAGVYWVYAAAAVAGLQPVAKARRMVGLFTLLAALWALALPLLLGAPWPQSSAYFFPAVFFTAFIGLLNVSTLERERYQRQLVQAAEENQRLAAIAERERIARDLHDLLGHTLSVVTLKAELAARLAERDPARAAREMREVERISREATAQVREAVQGYKSRGLQGELAGAKLALETAGIQLDYHAQPLTLSPTQEMVLSLALREAVTNVIRHSSATRCTVRLLDDGDSLRLEVEDNGKGGPLEEGSGLQGMRQRAQALGGSLEYSSTSGTRLTLRLPHSEPGRVPSQAPSTTLHPKPDTL